MHKNENTRKKKMSKEDRNERTDVACATNAAIASKPASLSATFTTRTCVSASDARSSGNSTCVK